MKKLSLLLLVLAVGSAGLYGQMTIGTNFTIEGDAKATVGYDIDDEQFGFKNEFSSRIKLELVAKDSKERPEEAMSGWYGSIELKEFQILIDTDEEDSTEFVATEGMMMDGKEVAPVKERTHLYVTEPDIVATLKNGPLWMKISSDAPDNKADLIGHIEEDEDATTRTAVESRTKDQDVGSKETVRGPRQSRLATTTPTI